VEYSRIHTSLFLLSQSSCQCTLSTLPLSPSSSTFISKCNNTKSLIISPSPKFVMLTSYNLLRSRFRRSHHHWFCTIVALKPEPPQPPPTTVTTTTSYLLHSRRFLFLGFDSRRHLHHSHHHSFHRSVFLSSSSNAFFSIIDYFKLIY